MARLALTYALADEADTVALEHLAAAHPARYKVVKRVCLGVGGRIHGIAIPANSPQSRCDACRSANQRRTPTHP